MDQAAEAKMTGRGMFALLAARYGIDWCEDRKGERMIAKHHEGRWVPTEGGGRTWDNGEEWSKENWPDSYNNIEGALTKVGRIEAMWYHIPSLNLVLFDGEQKVGIRMSDFRIMLRGFKTERIQVLIDGIDAKMRGS